MSVLPNMDWKIEVLWLITLFCYNTKMERNWQVCLFEGMRWGLKKRQRGFDDLAVHYPVDLAVFVVFGLALLLDQVWSKTPITDKGLALRKETEEKAQEVVSKRRPSLY